MNRYARYSSWFPMVVGVVLVHLGGSDFVSATSGQDILAKVIGGCLVAMGLAILFGICEARAVDASPTLRLTPGSTPREKAAFLADAILAKSQDLQRRSPFRPWMPQFSQLAEACHNASRSRRVDTPTIESLRVEGQTRSKRIDRVTLRQVNALLTALVQIHTCAACGNDISRSESRCPGCGQAISERVVKWGQKRKRPAFAGR